MKELGDILQSRKPEIDYPCSWQYKVIGWDREAIAAAVCAIVGEGVDYTLMDSRASSKGRYISMNLELMLSSEEMRLSLYQQLCDHIAVKLVL